MSRALDKIDKFARLSDHIALSGQPSVAQFDLLRESGYQMVVHLNINETETLIENECDVVTETGMLYEEIPVSFNKPERVTFEQSADILQQYKTLKLLIHCTAGYCISVMLIPYLVLFEDYSLEDARALMPVKQFSPEWEAFMTDIIESYRAG